MRTGRPQYNVVFSVTMALLLLSPITAYCWTHIARKGESLEHLAVRYYGSAKKTIVIRAANGFVHPDDGGLTSGEQVEIPEVAFYRISGNETWKEIADRYLASEKRGRFLAQLNGYEDSKLPAKGTIIKIPYHLRHIFAANESLKAVTRSYYGRSKSTRWLKKYNLTQRRKFSRGAVLIVPLIDLIFTEEEQKRIDVERSNRYTEKDVEGQDTAREGIADLKNAFVEGQYIKIVALAQELLGKSSLTVPQQIGVYKYLGFAYIALDDEQLALSTFKKALELQPGMDLSPITTSPKILKIFARAKETLSIPPDKEKKPSKTSSKKKKKSK